MRLCAILLRLAAQLAPSDIRADWLREWRAEVHAARYTMHRPGRRGSQLALPIRCCGAFAHALWLRCDRWRLDMLGQDLRYAFRTLVRRPAYAVLATLTRALGIGANATIFSAVHAVLLRPLPFPAPDQLVQLSSTTTARPRLPGGAASPPDFVDWRTSATSFAEMAAINAGSIPWSGYGPAEQVPYAQVTGGFFAVLGVPPQHGRGLGHDDERVGSEDVVVLSHALWVRRFGGNPGAVGRTMTLDGVPRRIVGVMPRGFAYPLGSELWLPLRFTPNDLSTQRGAQYLDVIARLNPGVDAAAAQSELDTIVAQLRERYPRTNANKALSVIDLRDSLVGSVRPALLVLLGAVGVVLLIVCVNLAGLSLTRAVGRTRELAIRAALGAGRLRLVRGLLLENVLLAIAGGATGLLLASWASAAIATLDTVGIPLLEETRIDVPVVMFTFGLSAAAALLFGTLPAWYASRSADVSRRMRADAGTLTASRDRQRLRGLLIVSETALAVALLAGAGLLTRSFANLVTVDLGFDPARVQTFSISLPEAKYATPQLRAELVDRLASELSQRPDVEAAGAIFGLPLTDFRYMISVSTIDGRRLTDDEQDRRSVQVRVVTPEYFRAMGIPVLHGRAFAREDRLGGAPVAIVNETAARLLWENEQPLGRQFTLGTRLGQGGPPAGGEVVGVVRDVRDFGPAVPVRAAVYLAHAQFPVDFVAVTVKARRAPDQLVAPIRDTLAALDPDLPMFRVRSMEQLSAAAVAQPRLYLQLIGGFALAAVALAAVGIYGVLMHAVAQRTREIGIRLALGARRGEVVALVVRQATALSAAGLGAGLVLAAGAASLLRDMLFGIEWTDPFTYAAVAVTLLLTALTAAYLPARRAARTEPVTALRTD